MTLGRRHDTKTIKDCIDEFNGYYRFLKVLSVKLREGLFAALVWCVAPYDGYAGAGEAEEERAEIAE